MKPRVLFITANDQGYLGAALENRLLDEGFEVVRCEDDVDSIHRHRHEADLILYYAEERYPRIDLMMFYLTDLCRDEHKSLCLAGDKAFVTRALAFDLSGSVNHIYSRPIDSGLIVSDLTKLAKAHEEYRRKKRIVIVDDDRDFLAIMERWLSRTYDVTCLSSGRETLEHFAAGGSADLILLDYEMPESDGYEVMKSLRREPSTASVPLIFLTGRNDRESVMRIIRHKPDGYLLKSLKKTELLDTLDRFFAESILK